MSARARIDSGREGMRFERADGLSNCRDVALVFMEMGLW